MSLEGKSAAFSDVGICDVYNLELSVSLKQNHRSNPHDKSSFSVYAESVAKLGGGKTIELQIGRT